MGRTPDAWARPHPPSIGLHVPDGSAGVAAVRRWPTVAASQALKVRQGIHPDPLTRAVADRRTRAQARPMLAHDDDFDDDSHI